MSFSGKRYRRVACKNLEQMIRITKSNESLLEMLKGNAPIFSFTRLDALAFRFCLESENKCMWYDFRLGEEFQMERKDGRRLSIKYTLENDHVLKQTIKKPNGQVIHFIKEFGETEVKMTIAIEGLDVKATIYYERIK